MEEAARTDETNDQKPESGTKDDRKARKKPQEDDQRKARRKSTETKQKTTQTTFETLTRSHHLHRKRRQASKHICNKTPMALHSKRNQLQKLRFVP